MVTCWFFEVTKRLVQERASKNWVDNSKIVDGYQLQPSAERYKRSFSICESILSFRGVQLCQLLPPAISNLFLDLRIEQSRYGGLENGVTVNNNKDLSAFDGDGSFSVGIS